MPDVERRFWDKVDKSGDCWVWTASRSRRGYGYFTIVRAREAERIGARRGSNLAHRVAYSLARGPVAPTAVVMHRCDNPPCVRPEHLALGTQADNLRDMIAKGRGCSKLTPSQALEIQRSYAAGEHTQCGLAAIYGVSQALISDVVLRRRQWLRCA